MKALKLGDAPGNIPLLPMSMAMASLKSSLEPLRK
jgi:hypothetical protein